MSGGIPRLGGSGTPVVFVLIWSTGFIVARYGMPHSPPIFSFWCCATLLSIACFLPGLLGPGGLASNHTQWLHLSVTGMLMHARLSGRRVGGGESGHGLWPVGVDRGLSTGAHGHLAVLQSARIGPAWRLARQWLGLALGFGGLADGGVAQTHAGSPMDHVTPDNMAFASWGPC
jgi:hypothetical protein